jgi:hypothetical protein
MPYPVSLTYGSSGDCSLMAKPNYAFAKRQRDLAKKKKKEEKALRKTGGSDAAAPPRPDAVDGDSST